MPLKISQYDTWNLSLTHFHIIHRKRTLNPQFLKISLIQLKTNFQFSMRHCVERENSIGSERLPQRLLQLLSELRGNSFLSVCTLVIQQIPVKCFRDIVIFASLWRTLRPTIVLCPKAFLYFQYTLYL